MASTTSSETKQSVAAGFQPRREVGFSFEDDGIPIREVIGAVWARRWFVSAAGLAGAIIAAAIAFAMPKWYTATAVILPPQQGQSMAASFLGQLGPLASFAGADLGLKTPSDLYVGLLGSRTIADHLIERFQLRTVYEKGTAIGTRKALEKHSDISAGRDSLIRIDVEDTDPARAAALANAYVAELNLLNKKIATTDAGQRRDFLEKRVTEEKVALAQAEDEMKQQQSKSGLIQPDAQASVAIGSVAQVRAQITAGEVALERLKLGATPQNPEVLRAEAQLNALRTQLRMLERDSAAGDALLATSSLPEAGLEYLRRLRELKYHETLFELLSKQYEAANLDASRAAPDIQIVDAAVVPDKKSWPPRAIITLLGFMVGLVLSSVVAYKLPSGH